MSRQGLYQHRQHQARQAVRAEQALEYARAVCTKLPQTPLKKTNLCCPMTDGYDCYQNALAERVNGILKDEFLFVLPNGLARACLLVHQAVQLSNQKRPHLALGYLIPNQVHQQAKSPTGKSERGPCLISVSR